MIPDNDFTRAVVEVSGNLKDVSNTISFSSMAINMFTQGPISLIWGLINCLQVISYFPLVNVAMPANMHHVFTILVKMANFDVIEKINEVVDHIEDETELKDDREYILSDSFEDFGFSSTDMIQNLQTIFLVLSLLFLAPFCLLILYLLCGWCRECKRCLSAIAGAIFMNFYIRFILESYLELCLSSMLRLQMLEFGIMSSNFHSSLSIGLLALVVVFPIVTGAYLMCRKNQVP